MILLILPNQLFAKHPGLHGNTSRVLLLEDSLFFGDPHHPARFHKQKLWLHRATMKRYEADLVKHGYDTTYLEFDPQRPNLIDQLRRAIPEQQRSGETLAVAAPNDFLFEKRLGKACETLGMQLEYLPNPGFLNSPEENREYRSGKTRWFMADFYKWQRCRFDILMNGDQPAGDQWSFDEDNRKKVPKKLLSSLPAIPSCLPRVNAACQWCRGPRCSVS